MPSSGRKVYMQVEHLHTYREKETERERKIGGGDLEYSGLWEKGRSLDWTTCPLVLLSLHRHPVSVNY